MPLNPKEKPQGWRLLDFTDTTHQEHVLFDSVICEFTDISGWDIEIYLADPDGDPIYGEDPNMGFIGPYRSKLTYSPTEERNMIDIFGFSSDDTIQYAMTPKTIWERDVIDELQQNRFPQAGDVIKTLWNNKIYEIVDVGAEQKIFAGRKMVWEFIMRPFRYAEQSETANDIMFSAPTSTDFPLENISIETFEPSSYNTWGISGSRVPPIENINTGNFPLSAYGDNELIETESNNIVDYEAENLDSAVYGYDVLK